MAIASICHVTVTVCQSEVCISVSVLVGCVDSCLHERNMTVAIIALFILYEDIYGGAAHISCFVLFVDSCLQ